MQCTKLTKPVLVSEWEGIRSYRNSHCFRHLVENLCVGTLVLHNLLHWIQILTPSPCTQNTEVIRLVMQHLNAAKY